MGSLQGAEEEVRDILQITRGHSIQKSMDKRDKKRRAVLSVYPQVLSTMRFQVRNLPKS